MSKGARDKDSKTYLTECLNNANWLVKSLDQRARTILKVASEIVRQQDAFLTYGVRHLRPLNLRTIADAIAMHESTVSRVTSNKYIATPRGVFELKYFFTASIQSVNGAESHSAEAVRDRIREMIENEERARNSFRRPHRLAADRGRREYRAPHRRQISRGHANPVFGGAPPPQGRQFRLRQFRQFRWLSESRLTFGRHRPMNPPLFEADRAEPLNVTAQSVWEA